MTYNVQELEELLRSNRIENASHKAALRERLFCGGRERKPVRELSVEELDMAAGGSTLLRIWRRSSTLSKRTGRDLQTAGGKKAG